MLKADVAAETGERSRSILWLPVIFSCATFYLYLLSLGFKQEDERSSRKFPTSVDDIREMLTYINAVKANNWGYLLLVFSSGYIYKQAFAVPGSVCLNVLAGAMFGPYFGFLLVCLLSAVGASTCYLLSQVFGKSYVVHFFPDKVKVFQNKVNRNRDGLFFFLLFLRLFPMSPNWFMNIVAPIVGVPVHLFFCSVLIGLMPYNFVCVQTGSVISQMTSLSDMFTMWTMLKMFLLASVALLPGLIINRLKVKFD
ncbi:transmembrane protein 41A-A-like [Physella acuta]|uniref:transmembrane protein 41A-A-like n=1 Tax=Physella acuta TaxID=109671 RepID=UPI0027DB9369|nr:transmembrane protein 41A-A-like [Physella acuta]XP_059177164.1 transmembrane protein 41A-A-like [Physella acuta]